jgi:hypothetical protein
VFIYQLTAFLEYFVCVSLLFEIRKKSIFNIRDSLFSRQKLGLTVLWKTAIVYLLAGKASRKRHINSHEVITSLQPACQTFFITKTNLLRKLL